jgi:hypothetical protein
VADGIAHGHLAHRGGEFGQKIADLVGVRKEDVVRIGCAASWRSALGYIRRVP